jgi:protoheme IX farnesyltransferase
VNALTMWMTARHFVGYAVIYTRVAQAAHAAEHRDRRPASGAMPPVLGWAAVTGRGRRRRDAPAS